jgi:hypothetical protein
VGRAAPRDCGISLVTEGQVTRVATYTSSRRFKSLEISSLSAAADCGCFEGNTLNSSRNSATRSSRSRCALARFSSLVNAHSWLRFSASLSSRSLSTSLPLSSSSSDIFTTCALADVESAAGGGGTCATAAFKGSEEVARAVPGLANERRIAGAKNCKVGQRQ